MFPLWWRFRRSGAGWLWDVCSLSRLWLANLAVNLKAVYIYFNNDAEAFAVRNAITIGDYLQATV